jgi:hypothetical protein
MKVQKYEIIDLSKEFIINMPVKAEILDISVFPSCIFLYALTEENDERLNRRFLPVVVGQPLDNNLKLKFIAVLQREDWLVGIIIFEIL